MLPLDENSGIVLAAGHLGLGLGEYLQGDLGLGIEVVLTSQLGRSRNISWLCRHQYRLLGSLAGQGLSSHSAADWTWR